MWKITDRQNASIQGCFLKAKSQDFIKVFKRSDFIASTIIYTRFVTFDVWFFVISG